MSEASSIPLSCYIRTLNEARRIGPVVRKVKETGAEVIVVDCGSTDGTQEIARTAGAKVIEKKWEGNGFQKRHGEDAASNDWLLDLDADELLTPELQNEIRALFKNGEPEPGIFSIRLVTVPPVPKGVVWNHSCVDWYNKLYHKSVVRIPAHAAYDHFKVPANIKPIRLKGSLLHYSFRDIEQQVAKMNRVSTVRATETKLKPKWLLAFRILFAFPVYFSKKYIKQKMHRAGIYGFACAAVIASNRWLKDVKMYERHLAKKGRNEI
jgi:glycosyltransferase involved in cell wall biosynthesis